MSAVSGTAEDDATFAGATIRAETLRSKRTRNYSRFVPRVVETARGLSPEKTAAYLHSLTGEPLRTWQDRLQQDRLSGDAVCALIASRDGEKYLDAIAGQSPWWKSIQRKLAAADEREHKYREVMNAFRSLTETEPLGGVSDLAGAADSTGTRRRAGPKA